MQCKPNLIKFTKMAMKITKIRLLRWSLSLMRKSLNSTRTHSWILFRLRKSKLPTSTSVSSIPREPAMLMLSSRSIICCARSTKTNPKNSSPNTMKSLHLKVKREEKSSKILKITMQISKSRWMKSKLS